MSGGPGGGLPPCVGETYSGFIEPTSGSTFDTGETINISWYGGRVQYGTGLTAIWDLVLVHSNDTIGWEKAIFNSKAFTLESNRTGLFWTFSDPCNNTVFNQKWTISADLNFSSTDFVLIAKNVTTDTENRTYTSDPFVIREKVASATIASIATSASISGTTSSSSTSRPTGTSQDSQLSTGAKAGIGTGTALAVITFLLLGCWLYRRRRDRKKRGAPTSAAEGYQKPELDGQIMKSPVEEADGQQIFEVDGGNATKQKIPPQDPVELPI
ncbi:hypothetical protein CNMCM8980_005976 [Aspergillus fumigatiaffinis]|jgi:hypothetical protein|uniref:Uncharacterized protein n=1 Tax=Aspergillus fumigatiaffinis TaxID=340414 RepID=A0A8H4HFQ1_9EURO|nr:hypothetical protein CNMCM5878_008688 [Aspergillus fumigatiaffinis]KAF4227735.1 hypothetical protein CNMCM6457_007364 [Aspergillus fumigatiaffinis]KAF4242618.1 hypothetical protein CNMCM6805_002690 [Aspergillus fumigatiaffinis]KAF4248423.1 hypothetical protein CNMCM8980_005976 [Aspergillus fumigatiaffinis]